MLIVEANTEDIDRIFVSYLLEENHLSAWIHVFPKATRAIQGLLQSWVGIWGPGRPNFVWPDCQLFASKGSYGLAMGQIFAKIWPLHV